MAYLGNPPAVAYSTVSYQDLTGGTGTSFTLNNAVANENEIEVFVNNVRQEPSVAYTASGTSLTMTGSIVATDDFYIVYQGKAQQTITPGANSITSSMLHSSLSLGAGYFQGENGATGDTTNGKGDIFRVHEQQLDTNTTIAAGDNAGCFFNLTVASGVTLTVNGNLVIA